VVSLADEATGSFQSWREQNAKAEVELSGHHLSHVGKLPGLVLRLSLILEYMWWSMSDDPEPQAIGLRSVEHAVELVESYFKPMALRIYGGASRPVAERNAASILKRIKRDRLEIINARDILRSWRIPNLNSGKVISEALQVCVDGNYLRENPSRRGDITGQPRKDYIVNPRFLSI
jgi:hypothetical protein